MNWMGGARNRVKLQHDKKKQMDFFEKRRLSQGRPVLPNQAWSRKRKLSQDLMALQTVSAFHSNVPSTGTSNNVKSVDLDKFKSCTKHFQEVDMGPVSPTHGPSKLFVMDCKGDHKLESETMEKSKTTSGISTDTRCSSKSEIKAISEEISKNKMTEEWAKPDTDSFTFKRKKDVTSKKDHDLSYDPFASEDFQCTPLVSYEKSKSKQKISGRVKDGHSLDLKRSGFKRQDGFNRYTCTSTPFDNQTDTTRKRRGPYKGMLDFDLSPISILKNNTSVKENESVLDRKKLESFFDTPSNMCSSALENESWLVPEREKSQECNKRDIGTRLGKQPRLGNIMESNCTQSSSSNSLNLNLDRDSDIIDKDLPSALELFNNDSMNKHLDTNRLHRSDRILLNSPRIPQMACKGIDIGKDPLNFYGSNVSEMQKLDDKSPQEKPSKRRDVDYSSSEPRSQTLFHGVSPHGKSCTKRELYSSVDSSLHELNGKSRPPYLYRASKRSTGISRTHDVLDPSSLKQSENDTVLSEAGTMTSFSTSLPQRQSSLSLYNDSLVKESPFVMHLTPNYLQSERSSGSQSGKSFTETPSLQGAPTKKPSFCDFDEEFTFTPRKDVFNSGKLRTKEHDIMNLYGKQREITPTRSNHSNGSSSLPRSPKVAEEFPSHLQRNDRTVSSISSADKKDEPDTFDLQGSVVASNKSFTHRKDMCEILEEMTQLEKQEEELEKASQERHYQQQQQFRSFLPGEKTSESFEADQFFESEMHDVMNEIPVEHIDEEQGWAVKEKKSLNNIQDDVQTDCHDTILQDERRNKIKTDEKEKQSNKSTSNQEPSIKQSAEEQEKCDMTNNVEKLNAHMKIKVVKYDSSNEFNKLEDSNLACYRTATSYMAIADDGHIKNKQSIKQNTHSLKIDKENLQKESGDTVDIYSQNSPVDRINQLVCLENINVSVQDPEVSSGKDHGIQCVIKQKVVDTGTSTQFMPIGTRFVDVGVQCDKSCIDAGVQCVILTDEITGTGDRGRFGLHSVQVDTQSAITTGNNVGFCKEDSTCCLSIIENTGVNDLDGFSDCKIDKNTNLDDMNIGLMDKKYESDIIKQDVQGNDDKGHNERNMNDKKSRSEYRQEEMENTNFFKGQGFMTIGFSKTQIYKDAPPTDIDESNADVEHKNVGIQGGSEVEVVDLLQSGSRV